MNRSVVTLVELPPSPRIPSEPLTVLGTKISWFFTIKDAESVKVSVYALPNVPGGGVIEWLHEVGLYELMLVCDVPVTILENKSRCKAMNVITSI